MVIAMAAKKTPPPAVSRYLAEIGRKGGQAKVQKGISALDPTERKKLATEAIKARWEAYYAEHPEKLKARKDREAKKGTVKRGRPKKKK
jgi:hypothetical protein